MPEIMTAAGPPLCPKCRSKALYRDDDEVNGIVSVACMKCGLRMYPGHDAEMSKNFKDGREEEAMEKVSCGNCGREKYCFANGLCSVCNRAAMGKVGVDREQALAEAKRKLDCGEIRTRRSPVRRSGTPIADAPPAPEGEKRPAEARPYRVPERGLAPSGETDPRIVPVTLRLAIEVTVKVTAIA